MQVRSQAGELEGASKPPSAGGKPAIAQTVDGIEGDHEDPVSAFVEVSDDLDFPLDSCVLMTQEVRNLAHRLAISVKRCF